MLLSNYFSNSFLFKTINSVPKRVRVFISTAVMVMLLMLSTFSDFTASWIIWMTVFILSSYILTYLSVFEGVNKIEWIMLFIMPVYFTVSMYLFYTLFPVRWLTRLPYLSFYFFGFYALLLSSNIFNVGVEKSIQLYRAAFSVNFLFQTVLVYLATQVIFSLKLNFVLNAILAFIIIFPLITQLTWTVNPQSQYDNNLIKFSFFVSLLIMEIMIILSFIPLRTTIQSLVLTAAYYSLSGIIYHYIDHKLFKQIIREYIFVIAFVIIIAMLTIQWK